MKYYIIVNTWDKKKKEYVGRCAYETRKLDRARKMFDQMQVSNDVPMIELYVETEDDNVRIDHKVCLKGIHVSE